MISSIFNESTILKLYFTIADFVSDLRAPTPSVAMELATPNIDDLKTFIKDSYSLSCELIEENLKNYKIETEQFLRSYSYRYPLEKINKFNQTLDYEILKLKNLIEKRSTILSNKINLLTKTLDAHNLDKSLKKGFALIKQNAKFVTRKEKFNSAKPALIKFYDGELEIK